MEPKFQTSFIPKKPINSPAGSGIELVHTTSIFSIIATVIFIVTILTSGALFFYQSLLKQQIVTAKKGIDDATKVLEPDRIKMLIDADNTIISSKSLLENHVVVSKVLSLLSELTVKKMRFTELNYTNKDGNPTLAISGVVQTYNALAEQQDAFLSNENIVNPMFSNFNLGDNGYILVNFSADIKPELVSYKNMIESGQ